MNQRVRQKIEASLAAKKNGTLATLNIAQAVAERVVSGEKVYTLEYVAERLHMDKTTAARKLRGKPGFLQHCVRGRITITESLFSATIREAASRGLHQ